MRCWSTRRTANTTAARTGLSAASSSFRDTRARYQRQINGCAASNSPATNRFRRGKEDVQIRPDLMPDGTARQFTFVMEAKSVITFPSGGQLLRARRDLYEISGLAWSGRGRITRVDVSHRRWRELERSSPSATRSGQMPDALSSLVLELGWRSSGNCKAVPSTRPGTYSRRVRSLSTYGGFIPSYHYNAIQTWQVAQDGAVTNVLA